MTQSSTRLHLPARFKYILPAAVVLLLVGGFFAVRLLGGAQSAPTPRSAAIEDRWGIRVTQLAVTADGGLLDLRYVVVDPDKALNLFEDDNTTPVVLAENTGAVVSAAVPMAHKHDLTPGAIYFLLFHNSNGAVKIGTPVSIVIGDLKLQHVVAR